MLKNSNLLAMIQNLIEVYRYEAEKPALNYERLAVSQIADLCVQELGALAEHKGIALSSQAEAQDTNVVADRMAIRRVIFNLLENAIKFTSSGGTIRLSCEDQDEFLIVRIADSGIGMSKSEQSHLFQRFKQGDRGKRYAAGTGLGLYLCREIVENHCGTISVVSEENEGTTMTVRLPRKPANAPELAEYKW